MKKEPSKHSRGKKLAKKSLAGREGDGGIGLRGATTGLGLRGRGLKEKRKGTGSIPLYRLREKHSSSPSIGRVKRTLPAKGAYRFGGTGKRGCVPRLVRRGGTSIADETNHEPEKGPMCPMEGEESGE